MRWGLLLLMLAACGGSARAPTCDCNAAILTTADGLCSCPRCVCTDAQDQTAMRTPTACATFAQEQSAVCK